MKLIKSWGDSQYGCKNYIYELKNGLKLVYVDDPKSKETNINILIDGGAYYDLIYKLPTGTAHFMEHVLTGLPNQFFNTREEIEEYKLGNQSRAKLVTNASTSPLTITFEGAVNSFSEERLMKYLYTCVVNPFSFSDEEIEKERGIILAERSHQKKLKFDETYQFGKFAVAPYFDQLVTNTIGEIKDIKAIQRKHLEFLYNKLFVKDNVVITIQKSGEIKPETLEYIRQMDEYLAKRPNEKLPFPKENPINERLVGYFNNTQENGIKLSFVYFDKISKKRNYKKEVLESLTDVAIERLSYLYLREHQNLIYSYETVATGTWFPNYSLNFISYVTSHENIFQLTEGIKEMVTNQLPNYLKSDAGQRWLESIKSSAKFPWTSTFNSAKALNFGYRVVAGEEVWEADKALKEKLEVTTNQILNDIETRITKVPKHTWITSNKKLPKLLDLYSNVDII